LRRHQHVVSQSQSQSLFRKTPGQARLIGGLSADINAGLWPPKSAQEGNEDFEAEQ
jgi:hypothetical protein